MRTFLISIICCILCSINISAQENVIFDLSGKPVVFQDRNSLELQGSLTGQTYIRFRALLNEDVFSYYDIEGYETALLKEEFLNSQKGKELARQLSELKKIICSDDIYYIYTFRSNRGYKKEYNLKTGKFDLEYVVDDRQFVPIAGYINFPYCVLKTSKIRQSVSQHEWYNYPGRYSYHTTISIPMPKTVALIVEKNIDDAALVVSFNSPRTKSTRWFTTVTGVATNFMIINIKTNEIYYSLDKNKLKELQIKQEREQQVKLAQERERQRQLEELEKAKLAKARADSIAAVGRIKEYIEKIDSSNIKTAVRDYEYKNYKKNARALRLALWRMNQSNLPVFSSYIENSHDVTLSIDSVAIEVVRIDEPVKYSGAKYVFDGTTYAVQDGGFICEAKIKSRLFAGYSDGIIMQWKKGLVTYIGADTSEEIDKSQIPLIISSELEKLVNTNGKYRVEYVFVDNIILSLTITKGKKVIYLQNYDDNGHLQKSGTLLTDPK